MPKIIDFFFFASWDIALCSLICSTLCIFIFLKIFLVFNDEMIYAIVIFKIVILNGTSANLGKCYFIHYFTAEL